MIANSLVTVLSLGFLGAIQVQTAKPPALKKWNFDVDKVGQVAFGFTSETGEWKVTADEKAASKPNVLAQLAKNDEKAFNVALITEPTGKNIDFRVKFRVAAGTIDQGGGVVWRAANAKNYYLCRYNPLEANIRVYKVVNGERIIIHSVENVEEKEGWQTMRVVTNGTRHEGHLNDQVRFSILEETFQEAGKVGLWSKADAQTHFDDLELEVMDR